MGEYQDDDNLYKYADFGFIGFDLWQVKGGTIFDNVIITDDVAEADAFAEKWKALSEHEKAKKKEEDDAKKAEADKKAEQDESDDDDDDEDDDKSEEMCSSPRSELCLTPAAQPSLICDAEEHQN